MIYGFKRVVSTFLLVLGIVGCSGLKTVSPQLEAKEVVAGLVASRWEALIQGDLDKAYTYLSPTTREVTSLELYKSQVHPGLWKKASVDSVVCEQDLCKVILVIEYSYRELKSVKTPLKESWLQENGKWWYIPNK
jgi:hypothetical protein